MSQPRRIVFWRHGRTIWNAEHRFQGQLDIDLDDEGRAQAQRAAAMLATLTPNLIITSDLARAKDTAQALADLTGLTPVIDTDLRETYAGAWQGLTRLELEERYADDLKRWVAAVDLRPGGDGETRTEVAQRVKASVERYVSTLEPGQTLVVVSHGGATRAGIGALLGLPPEQWSVLGVLGNCSWSVLVETLSEYGAPWRLQEYNAGTLPEPTFADDR